MSATVGCPLAHVKLIDEEREWGCMSGGVGARLPNMVCFLSLFGVYVVS